MKTKLTNIMIFSTLQISTPIHVPKNKGTICQMIVINRPSKTVLANNTGQTIKNTPTCKAMYVPSNILQSSLTATQMKLLQFYGQLDSNKKPTSSKTKQKVSQSKSSYNLIKQDQNQQNNQQNVDSTQKILKIIDDSDNQSLKIQKCQSIDNLNIKKSKPNKHQDSVYKSIQQLLKSQMFENEHTKKYESELKENGKPSKPVWNDHRNAEKRHQDVNYSEILGKESQAKRNISNDSNNIRKDTFNKTSNQNFNPALKLNAFQKKQRDNNSTMDNFQQRFLRCRVSFEPKDECLSFKNNSRTKQESQQLRQKMLKSNQIFKTNQ